MARPFCFDGHEVRFLEGVFWGSVGLHVFDCVEELLSDVVFGGGGEGDFGDPEFAFDAGVAECGGLGLRYGVLGGVGEGAKHVDCEFGF